MNEFSIIKKYLSPLTKRNDGSLNLKDDIFFDRSKKILWTIFKVGFQLFRTFPAIFSFLRVVSP